MERKALVKSICYVILCEQFKYAGVFVFMGPLETITLDTEG